MTRTCIHSECERSPDPEVAGLACCMACALAWGARTTPVHIGRCDRRAVSTRQGATSGEGLER